ncbi:MAG: hypothetical protein R3F61_18350 [Myxococcota bacterium]
MPKLAADQAHADATTAQLHEQPGLQHLRVRKHGAAIVIESGPAGDAFKHARLVRDTSTLWGLEIADHRGRWEHTGMRATRSELVDALMQEFGWVLTNVDGENPERISDPKY